MQYLMINQETNTVENVIEWDGNTSTWSPPENYFILPAETTPSATWQWDDAIDDYELVDNIGFGGIGGVWDGARVVQPKPTQEPIPEDQPATTGTQNL